MPRKMNVPMLLVKNEEGENVFFHISDEVRASRYGEPKQVYVIMDSDYFIGTWQFAKTINGYVGYYNSEEEALAAMRLIAKS